MINRTISPRFKQVEDITFIKAEQLTFNNGLTAYVINGGDQELIRIELFFKNVNWDFQKPLLAFAVNTMLNDGTTEFTAFQLAESVDYYGAFLQTDYSYDHSSITLYTLNKHLEVTLKVLKTIITDSIFPQVELATFIRNQKQKLRVNLEKNDVVGRRVFSNALFGNTIYGYPTSYEDYDALNREDLLKYFKTAYQPGNCTLIASGKVNGETKTILNDVFGQNWQADCPFLENKFLVSKTVGKEHYTEKEDALQSALRIGTVVVNRNHPDFPGLQVLNTILGGYFGSRLMTNLREDKGYTYGIGSAIVSLENAGYFFIASEVGANVCADAIKEIKKEIDLLRTVAVSEEELSLVRNYMLGSLLGDLENIFSHADKFKNIFFFGLGYEYYGRFIQTIKKISSSQLLSLAKQYLNFEEMDKVIVGKK